MLSNVLRDCPWQYSSGCGKEERPKALLGKFPVPSAADFNPAATANHLANFKTAPDSNRVFNRISRRLIPSPFHLSLAYRSYWLPRSCSVPHSLPGSLSKRLIILLITSFFPVPECLPFFPSERYASTANPLKLVILEDFFVA